MGRQHAKPFLKWAGGKRQLLPTFEAHFPSELKQGNIKHYFEPFVGSGAVFFHVAQNYDFEKAYLYDINEELILAYQVIKRDITHLVEVLAKYREEYMSLNDRAREHHYYEVRKVFNQNGNQFCFEQYSNAWIERTAQLIFLNKTCFNGLFRVNSKGHFNVPFGRYKNPAILDEANLLKVSQLLARAEIEKADFTKVRHHISEQSFVYFDPPYRPLSQTACFTSYSRHHFNDQEQQELARLFKELTAQGAKLMLSNSDPKNNNPQDNFFEELYEEFIIKRVQANRMINSNASKRGKIHELLIRNYEEVA